MDLDPPDYKTSISTAGPSVAQGLEARIQHVEARLESIANTVHKAELRIQNSDARQFNSQARDPLDQLQPLQMMRSFKNGSVALNPSPLFPHTLKEAINLQHDAPRLAKLLQFYYIRVLKPGCENPWALSGPEKDALFINTASELEVEANKKECFTTFVRFIGLDRKAVEMPMLW